MELNEFYARRKDVAPTETGWTLVPDTASRIVMTHPVSGTVLHIDASGEQVNMRYIGRSDAQNAPFPIRPQVEALLRQHGGVTLSGKEGDLTALAETLPNFIDRNPRSPSSTLHPMLDSGPASKTAAEKWGMRMPDGAQRDR